ncbi:MAG: nitrile hydratase subunit alpha [Gammaproteobacteria bacterium]|nr:nitrile hydratase subunit alpha [Gammaproteobacteria bacterium]MBI5615643.1 nitrile hydratase subunit alpha [Gammaproteobacteria bacterium]
MSSHDHEHEHSLVPSEPALRIKALESLLVEKGVLDPAAVDEIIDVFEHRVGPRNGALVVAKAWTDPEFRKRLLADGTAAVRELGFLGMQGEEVVAVENTQNVHNVVVCTLCSCYPWPLLGLPPAWYKSLAYRSRVVIEPRKVLEDFGLKVSDDKEVRVWDSNSEVRYIVLPERPAGSETLSEAELAELVTRESMIGTGVAKAPA